MTRNPLINALAAAVYIALVATFMSYAPERLGINEVFAITTFLSIFVLSAALMGYIFGYTPARLYLDGQKTEGAKLFLQTLAIFAAIVVVFVLIITFVSY